MSRNQSQVPNMDCPVPFIQTLDNGKWAINDDLVNVLSQNPDPVSVISIVGKYRTGKSYIMNRFFNSNAGFSLGQTVQSFTKGIWLWAKPHPLDKTRTLILLDTEGLRDVEKGDTTHDMQLFSLALLLSNCMVYNAVGNLDDTIVQELHLVTELTEHIKTREGDNDGNHFNNYFPKLFIVLRDFFLNLEIDGKACTSKEYMENALKTKSGNSSRVMNYNLPRQCIRGFFPDRMCFTLCKPVDDDAKLRQLDLIRESEIKPEFLAQAKEAVETILRAAKPFEVENNTINGTRFIDLARTYVDAINNKAIPCISNAVDLLKANECQRALEGAVIVFDEHMRDCQMPLEIPQLEAKQKIAHDAAVKHYHTGALFDNEQNYLKKLAAELEKKYQMYLRENDHISGEKCTKVLQDSFKDLDKNMKSGVYIGKRGYEKYKADRQNAVEKYCSTPNKGPMAEKVLNHYLERRKNEEDAIINADKALSEKQKELAIAEEENKRQQERTRLAEAEQQKTMQDFLRQQNEHKEMVLNMQSDYEERQIKMREEYMKDMQAKESEYNRLMSEGLDKQAEQYKVLIDDMKEDRENMEMQHQQQMEQLQSYQKDHSALLDEIKQQRQASNMQIELMQQQMKELQSRPSGGGFPCCIQ